jgi:hypothetical protein
MRFETWISDGIRFLGTEHFACVLIGVFCGILSAGIFMAAAVHLYSRRLFRWRVLDEVRRELRDPLMDYVDWLHEVSAQSSAWKGSLMQSFAALGARDPHEVNRLRRLFIDPRSQAWFDRLEEYETVLGRFRNAVKELWIRQVQIQEHFNSVLRLLESSPTEAAEFGRILEHLAFEQSQLVSDFLYHLQYECLKSVADAAPKSVKKARGKKTRLERTSMGRIRPVSPVAEAVR